MLLNIVTFHVMQHSIIYIMGVSGSGKTTIGKLLADKTSLPFFDADDFHSDANKEKMKAGIPLTDEDRKDWLQKLNKLADTQAAAKGAIIACSALKEKYRVVLSEGISHTAWIFLQGTYEEIHKRLASRKGHYMPVELLKSQMEALEIPANAFTVSIDQKPEEMVQLILNHLTDKKFL